MRALRHLDRPVRVLFVIAAGFAVVACTTGTPAPSSEPPGGAIQLPGTSWRAISVLGQPPVAGAEPRVAFAATSIEGTDGCNGFGGDVSYEGGGIRLGEVATTLIGCDGPVGETAGRFMRVLGDVRQVAIVEGQLHLAGPAGEAVLVPAPAPAR
jgi:heat shock protein HslJ